MSHENNGAAIVAAEPLESVNGDLTTLADRIVDLARGSADRPVRTFHIRESSQLAIVDAAGETRVVDLLFDPADLTVHNLDGLFAVWDQRRDVWSEPTANRPDETLTPGVFTISDDCVSWCHNSTGRVRAGSECLLSMPIKWSDALTRLHAGFMGNQADAIRWLRSSMSDHVPNVQTLIRALRSLRWSSTAATTSTVKSDRSSYGNEIDQSIRADGGVELSEWETFNVEMPAIDDPAFAPRYVARCFLDVDHQTQRIEIGVFQDEIDAIRRRALHDLAEFITDRIDQTQHPDVVTLGFAAPSAWSRSLDT